MRYLHTMLRVNKLDSTLDFFCNKLEMVEINRHEDQKGRFTLVFLAATNDAEKAKEGKAPLLELTYNWPSEHLWKETERYTAGRNFGHLAYEVDDIYAACEKLKSKGVIINRPPRDGKMAVIKTPDGISIELLQKGSPLEVREPWASMDNEGAW